jgi:uncharacterized coiled-coil DUF342 family protein
MTKTEFAAKIKSLTNQQLLDEVLEKSNTMIYTVKQAEEYRIRMDEFEERLTRVGFLY